MPKYFATTIVTLPNKMPTLSAYRPGGSLCIRHIPRRFSRARSSIPRRLKSTKSTSKRPAPEPSPEDCIPTPNSIPPQPLSIWQRLGPFTTAANAYSRAQKNRPYTTQLCTSLAIFFFGDLASQSISNDESYDAARTGRSLIIGGVSSIPSYKWFLFLGRHFNYSSHMISLAVKIVVNQSLFAPAFNIYFFGMQCFLSGGSMGDVIRRVRDTVPTSIINSWKLWPAVTAFSFTFIRPESRSAFAGIIAIGWQTYLGLLNRRAEELAATGSKHDVETAPV